MNAFKHLVWCKLRYCDRLYWFKFKGFTCISPQHCTQVIYLQPLFACFEHQFHLWHFGWWACRFAKKMGHAALRGLMQTPKPKSTTYHLALLSKRIMVRFMATWIRTAALPTWTRPVFCSTYCAPVGGSYSYLLFAQFGSFENIPPSHQNMLHLFLH